MQCSGLGMSPCPRGRLRRAWVVTHETTRSRGERAVRQEGVSSQSRRSLWNVTRAGQSKLLAALVEASRDANETLVFVSHRRLGLLVSRFTGRG